LDGAAVRGDRCGARMGANIDKASVWSPLRLRQKQRSQSGPFSQGVQQVPYWGSRDILFADFAMSPLDRFQRFDL